MTVKLDEVCRVRRDAVGRDGVGYTLAVCRRMNKTTARVILYDEWMTDSDAKSQLVPLNTLWRIKARQRAQLEKRAKARRTAVPSPPAADTPLFSQVEIFVRTFQGVQVVARLSVSNLATKLLIGYDSVVKFTGDAIVNAANQGCLGGGGIDGEINRRGGQDLHDAREALPLVAPGTRCKTGDAKITISGDLPCEKVIHAVGPRFGYFCDHSDDLAILSEAYSNSLKRAREAGLKSVGFCLLSAGIFSGNCPLKDIVRVGLETLARKAYPELESIVLCGFTQGEREVLAELVQSVHESLA